MSFCSSGSFVCSVFMPECTGFTAGMTGIKVEAEVEVEAEAEVEVEVEAEGGSVL